MKALIYKEFKLSMHPMCYVFIIIFPIMILIPSYPIAIGFIYVLTCYPILFLGANKGQQSNDLLFSTLLPVRKKDIVLARILTVIILQFIFIAITSCLFPLANFLSSLLHEYDNSYTIPGIGFDGFISIIALVLIGYGIADLIFLPTYYKNGKSIVLPTLLTIFGFAIYICLFTIIFPYLPSFSGYTNFLSNSKLWVQFIFLAISLIIYVLLHLLTYKISSKRLDLVDF